jgi:hypothetical protein
LSVGGFDEAYAALRELLAKHEASLRVVRDTPEEYYLDTEHVLENGKPLFFGAVSRRARYVAYYLMPVYVFPELLEGASPELRRRMQGKSCFNFRSPDETLFRELGGLTDSGLARFRREGYV